MAEAPTSSPPQQRRGLVAALLAALLVAAALYAASPNSGSGGGNGERATSLGFPAHAAHRRDRPANDRSPPPSATHTPRPAVPPMSAHGPDVLRHSEGALRESTGCGGRTLANYLVLHVAPTDDGGEGGSGDCTPGDLFRAMHAGRRRVWDGPFHMTLPRRCVGRVGWRTSAEACDILQGAGFLFVSGDSLARHIVQALFTILAADVDNATDILAAGDVADQGHHACTCEDGYDDGHGPRWVDGSYFLHARNRFCREHAPAYAFGYFAENFGVGHEGLEERLVNRTWLPLPAVRARYPGFCPKWDHWHLCLGCVEAGRLLGPGAFPPSPRGVVFSQGGLHYPYLDSLTAEIVFNQPHSLALGVPDDWPRLCSLLHAPGANKPLEYQGAHGFDATAAFNAIVLNATCTRPGDVHFDAFAVTNNATSIDGQHYFQEPNVLLAQLLLNMLALMAPATVEGGAHRR